jgi:hypothetical protein
MPNSTSIKFLSIKESINGVERRTSPFVQLPTESAVILRSSEVP